MICIPQHCCHTLWMIVAGFFLYILTGPAARATKPVPVPVFQMSKAVFKVHSPFAHNAYGSGFFIGSPKHFVTAFHNIRFLVDTPHQTFRLQDILLSPRMYPSLDRDQQNLKVSRVLRLDPSHDIVLLEVEGHRGPVLKPASPDLTPHPLNPLTKPGEMYMAGFLGKDSLFKMIKGSYVPRGPHSGQNLLFIQNHESTVQGMSGGPLLNPRGEAVGMVSAVYTTPPPPHPLSPGEKKTKLLRLYPRALKGNISAFQDLINTFKLHFYAHQLILHIIPVENFLETNNTPQAPGPLRDQVQSSLLRGLKNKNLTTNEESLIILATLVESDILHKNHLSREDTGHLLKMIRKEMISLYKTAALKEGGREVQFHLGRVLSTSPHPDEKAQAQKWLTKAARKGHFLAQYDLGRLLIQTGQASPYEEATLWIKSSAEQGYSEAMHILGVLSLNKNNIQEAAKWFRRAAEQDHTLSQMMLSFLLLHPPPPGEDKKEGQKEESREWLVRAMERVLGYPPPEPKPGGFISKLKAPFQAIKCIHLFK